jgi:hypothetical protein
MTIPLTYPVFKREIANNMYQASAYFLAKLVASILTFFIYPLLCTTFTIWFFGLQVLTFKTFCSWWLDLSLVAFVGSAFGMMLGCLLTDGMSAILVNNVFVILFSLGGGLLINVNSSFVAKFLGWVSPFKYGSELILRRLLDGQNSDASDEVLNFLGYQVGSATCIWTLIMMYLGCIGVGLVALVFRAK